MTEVQIVTQDEIDAAIVEKIKNSQMIIHMGVFVDGSTGLYGIDLNATGLPDEETARWINARISAAVDGLSKDLKKIVEIDERKKN